MSMVRYEPFTKFTLRAFVNSLVEIRDCDSAALLEEVVEILIGVTRICIDDCVAIIR